MSAEQAAERIARQGRHELHARLRSALLRQAGTAAEPLALEASDLDALVEAAAARAGGVLWRRCLAAAAVNELRIQLADAVSHPDVVRAHELVGAPPYERPRDPLPPEPTAAPAAEAPTEGRAGTAVRLAAVHLSGIESLRNGESDLELRFSDAGLDLLKGSSGAPIGRLLWSEIQNVEVARAPRGRRPGRRAQRLLVRAQRGQASFELPGLTAQQIRDYLDPMLTRARDADRRR